jgi:hypothetical protein
MNQFTAKILTLILLVLAAALAATAQEATIVGTVTDPTGASVPNVAVSITNTETGVVRRLTTNESGQYVAPNLRIGSYTIRAEVTGFKVGEQRDVILTVGLRARVDFSLEIGSSMENISVEANAIQVQTETGEVSDIVSGQQISQLATNGRSLYNLAMLTAGASSDMPDFQQATPAGGNANVSFNGMRQNHNLWTIDGGEASDRGGAGGASVSPSVDAIAEFRVLSSNYSAEFGLSSAATFTMVVKSGTKDFHGTGYEFFRNDALNTNDYFFNAAGKTVKPKLRFNTYGFNIGGPVTLGSAYNKNKDKTFFFYNMEWRKLIQGGSLNQTVPRTSTYGGQFTSQVRIPRTDQLSPEIAGRYAALGLSLSTADQTNYFPNNTIPAALLDSNAQALVQAGIFPAPTSGAQFVGGMDAPTNVREEIIRADHRFNDKFWVFGHYINEAVSQTFGTSLWSGSNVPTVGTTFGNPSYHYVIRATHSISANLLNEMSFNSNGNKINIVPNGLFKRPSGANIAELFSGNNDTRIPQINLSGSTGANYDVASWPWHNKADDYQIRDDISWARGSHQFKFGASWALYKKVQDLFGQTQGGFNFNGAFTGNDFADFLLGYANSYTELALQDTGRWNNVSVATYFQDNWRVNRRLTLNLGLRWEGIPHTYEENKRGSNFYPHLYDPAKRAILTAGQDFIDPRSPGLGKSANPALQDFTFYLNGIGVPGQAGIPSGLTKNYWNTFGPRLGLAYDLTGQGKTILRGGFGVMYERIQGNDMYNGGPNVPFSASVTFNQVALANPKLSVRTGEAQTAPITIPSITGLALNYKIPTSYQYSLGVQHELFKESVVSVSYVGNQNRHQTYYQEVNLPSQSVLPALINGTTAYNGVLPYAGFGSIRLLEPGMNSHYNGLQVNFRSQARRDLSVQAAYTFARAIDASTGFGADMNNSSNPYDRNYDYGPSFSDRRQVGLINFVYKLPILNSAKGIVKTVGGGWELSGIVMMQTGLVLNITQGGSQGNNGLPNSTNRPDINGSVTYPQLADAWFDTSVFSSPAIGAWGNSKRGDVRGPGRHNWNLSLFKNFMFTERIGLEFRVESFNTWNHTQFRNVSSTFSASNFGDVTSVWDPRVFQLGMKFKF